MYKKKKTKIDSEYSQNDLDLLKLQDQFSSVEKILYSCSRNPNSYGRILGRSKEISCLEAEKEVNAIVKEGYAKSKAIRIDNDVDDLDPLPSKKLLINRCETEVFWATARRKYSCSNNLNNHTSIHGKQKNEQCLEMQKEIDTLTEKCYDIKYTI